MNLYALVAGIFLGVFVVLRFKKTRLERKPSAYPLLLATFPAYYCVFAIYASDYDALAMEFLVGITFLLIAYTAYKLNNLVGLLILATGYIIHAVYDVIHESIFSNAGTPLWWPEFCGAVDFLIGVYLLYFAFSIKTRKTNA